MYNEQKSKITDCGFDYGEGIYFENLNGEWNNDQFSHNMEWVAEKAVEFIKNDTDTKPFFLYLNPTIPHSSGNVYQALTDAKFACTVTPEGNVQPPDVKGMTEGTTCEDYRADVVRRAQPASESDNNIYGSIWLDDAVGAMLQALRDTDQLDNTFFLFQLDHGQDAKGTLYEQVCCL